MASYFGELLEDDSRAIDGGIEVDDSIDDQLNSEYELSWLSGDAPAETDFFIVIDGKCVSGFSALLRSKANAVAEITKVHKKVNVDANNAAVHRKEEEDANITEVRQKENEEEPSLSKSKEQPSYVYELKKGIYLCEVSPDIPVFSSNLFTAKIHEWLKKSKEVVILASKTSLGYISSEPFHPPFMRGICSSRFNENGKKLLVPLMDTSNLITGVSASVLTWCEAMGIVSSLYVCYTPKCDIDKDIYRLLVKIFSQLSLISNMEQEIHFDTKECSISQKTGNLYL